MAGADTVIRLIGATLGMVVVAVVAAFGYQIADPVYNNVIDPNLMSSLGWGAPQDTVLQFMGFGLIGLPLVILIWWWVAPVREDTRQEQQPPRGPL